MPDMLLPLKGTPKHFLSAAVRVHRATRRAGGNAVLVFRGNTWLVGMHPAARMPGLPPQVAAPKGWTRSKGGAGDLPYRQQRRLRRIGRVLRGSDPHLTAMLSIFARLTARERMPAREQLGPRRRGIWPLLTRLLGLVGRLAAGGADATSAGLRRAIARCRRIVQRARPWINRKQAAPAAGHAARPSHGDLPRSSPDT